MKPVFSVVIPTYNRPYKVVRAIKSVLAQTFNDYEIWVIDDGSTEKYTIALEPFKSKINYLYKPNGGLSSARNAGILKSNGTYVAFLDDDDWWYPHKLEYLAQAIQDRPDVGLFYSNVDFVKENGEKLWVQKSRNVGKQSYLLLLKGNIIPMPTVVVKKSCFNEVGLFDEKLKGCEDWDMWIRIAQRFPFHFVNKVLGAYEYASSTAMSADHVFYINAITNAFNKIISENKTLELRVQRIMYAFFAHNKGRIYLRTGHEVLAQKEFKESLKLGCWRSFIYIILLKNSWMWSNLPLGVKRLLRAL